MISTWKIDTPQTYPKHSSTISKLAPEGWLVCRMGAVGVWRIIPRIRTALKPFDHQIGHHRGWTPSYHARASLRLHNLPLSAVQDIPGTGGKTKKTALRICQLCLPSTGWKKLRPTGGDAENQLGGKLVDAGGSMLTATARPSIPGFFGAANCFSLNISLGVNVRENSSMLKQEHYPYCILFYNIQDSHPGP